MKTFAKTLALATGLALAAAGAPAAADAGSDALAKGGCMACHTKDKKLVGPAFKDIAARYKGQADAPAKLFDKVRKGGAGVYGPVPMPPNGADKIDDAGLKAAVESILKT